MLDIRNHTYVCIIDWRSGHIGLRGGFAWKQRAPVQIWSDSPAIWAMYFDMVVEVSRLSAWGLASLGLAAASVFSMYPWALGALSCMYLRWLHSKTLTRRASGCHRDLGVDGEGAICGLEGLQTAQGLAESTDFQLLGVVAIFAALCTFDSRNEGQKSGLVGMSTTHDFLKGFARRRECGGHDIGGGTKFSIDSLVVCRLYGHILEGFEGQATLEQCALCADVVGVTLFVLEGHDRGIIGKHGNC